jgi:hypothetical protein
MSTRQKETKTEKTNHVMFPRPEGRKTRKKKRNTEVSESAL